MKIDYKKIAEELIPIFEEAGQKSIDLYNKGLKIEIKEDGSPVSNGDLKVNEIISKKIKQLTPDIPIISEETVNIKEKNKNTVFWLIDPIDGTKEYISGKDEYTLNAALVVDKKPIIGLVGVPKKKQLFYSYAIGQSFIRQNLYELATLEIEETLYSFNFFIINSGGLLILETAIILFLSFFFLQSIFLSSPFCLTKL